ncbi:MAG: NAD(P)H-binding protein [Proteobacteria bacterium]|nr:NAD(P)H-binding protein [Pseudomonadota bacterium]
MTLGPVVICGARGFVGSRLVRSLLAQGFEVRAGTRSPERARQDQPEVSWVELEVENPDTLDRAFAGAAAVVYLVHQMRSGSSDLEALEARSARHVAEAAARAGVARIVYLGGPSPEGPASKHLRARLATGEVFRAGSVPTVELRAGMIIGAQSESWLIVRDLAMRLPVMILPSWLSSRSQPIGIDDVVAALTYSLQMPEEQVGCYDLPGPETLSARQILERVSAHAGIRPVMIPVPVLTPSLSSHWIRLVTRADITVARKLIDGLIEDLVASGQGFWAMAPDLPRVSLDEAIHRALAEETSDSLGRRGRVLEFVARWVGRATEIAQPPWPSDAVDTSE